MLSSARVSSVEDRPTSQMHQIESA